MNERITKILIITISVFAIAMLSSCSKEHKADEQQGLPKVLAEHTPTIAPNISTKTDSGDVAKDIKLFENDLLEAFSHGDTIAMDHLIDDQYTVGLPNGEGFGDKYSELTGAKNLTGTGFEIKNDTMQVSVYKDVAVVTKLLTETIPAKGKRHVTQSLWTNTWIRRNNEWKLFASQGTYLTIDSTNTKK